MRGTIAPKSQDPLTWLLPDDSLGGLVLSKALIHQPYFQCLNRISLFITSSSYPIVLTRLGRLRSILYTSRKMSKV